MSRRIPPTGSAPALHRGFFWVPGEVRESEVGTVSVAPMYVEWLSPERVTRPLPIVLIHGGGGQGLDYLGTPDGRPGWAPELAAEGFAVYVVDRPGHGRASFHPDLLGPMTPPAPYEVIDAIFVDPPGAAPRAPGKGWPGASGTPGDAVMDQFIATTGPMRADWPRAHADERERMAALLDQIGPSILLAHSAGGPAGFLAVDARPDLVAALIAIEPLGPPFATRPATGLSLDWGLAAAPLTFDPPVDDATELAVAASDRKLANLPRAPILMVATERSPLAANVPVSAAWLNELGCEVEILDLGEAGVEDCGHGVMAELGSRQALGLLTDWLGRRSLA
jgi:pimeloyl-ACP methyl ester carboxylesterase